MEPPWNPSEKAQMDFPFSSEGFHQRTLDGAPMEFIRESSDGLSIFLRGVPSENARWSPHGIHQRKLRWAFHFPSEGSHQRTLDGAPMESIREISDGLSIFPVWMSRLCTGGRPPGHTINVPGIHKRKLCGHWWLHAPVLCSRCFGFVRPVPFR
jgi:hypothetical protein